MSSVCLYFRWPFHFTGISFMILPTMTRLPSHRHDLYGKWTTVEPWFMYHGTNMLVELWSHSAFTVVHGCTMVNKAWLSHGWTMVVVQWYNIRYNHVPWYNTMVHDCTMVLYHCTTTIVQPCFMYHSKWSMVGLWLSHGSRTVVLCHCTTTMGQPCFMYHSKWSMVGLWLSHGSRTVVLYHWVRLPWDNHASFTTVRPCTVVNL